MRGKIIRILMAVLVLGLLAYAFSRESHTIHSLSEPSRSTRVDGVQFTEIATYDGLMLKDGELYDIHSLTPEILQVKDCAT